MGKQITIYDNGQTYEIDSDLIYIPVFDKPKEEKSDTVSETKD